MQTGATFGGALKKDKTFYFSLYEYTQRDAPCFSIREGTFGLAPLNCGVGCPLNGLPLTSSQSAATLKLLQAAATTTNPLEAAALQQLAGNYATLMGSASSVATNALDYGAVVNSLSGGSITPVNPVVTPGGVLFGEFPLPVACEQR